ncbi:ABC transporter permease [Bacillus testis]|uniref:ABC transporter permease n=1 Tax=Bacillus testis TaxID=1622072 RepID=UPI00067F5B99|nr:FtsX-like permease family protein [Bacillus testis]
MFLALKELKHGKLRFLMIGLIFVLISWLVFLLSGLGTGLNTLSAASFKNIDANYVAFEKGARASMSRSIISEDAMDQIKEQKNVNKVAPLGAVSVTIMKDKKHINDDDKYDVTVLGAEPNSFLIPKVTEGKTISASRPNDVIVNDSLKDKGFKIGDTVKVESSDEKMKIVGFMHNETYNHVATVYAPVDKFRSMRFAAPKSDDGVKNPVNAIMIQGDDLNAKQIEKNIPGLEVVTKDTAIQGMPGHKEENGTITMMLVFLLAISAVVIAVFFYVLTLQKSNQFGIMKAIGASNGFLGRTIVSQVFILSLSSILVGALLAYLVAVILPEGTPFSLDPKLVLIYGIVLLIVSVLSSILSVRKITKIDPLQAIGRVE